MKKINVCLSLTPWASIRRTANTALSKEESQYEPKYLFISFAYNTAGLGAVTSLIGLR